jgi:uncharacterized protein YhdP
VENNDFYMKGGRQPAGKGIADLVRWRLDFDLSFSPNLGGTLPVVAAFSLTPSPGSMCWPSPSCWSPWWTW